MIKFKKIINCIQNLKFYKSYFHGVSPLFELLPLLKKISKAKTLIDVGSNKGQFILIVKNCFPNIKIFSFEPQISELKIQKKILGYNKITYFIKALGNKKKKMTLYITNRKDSSSVLEPIQLNKKYEIKYKKKITVERAKDVLKKKIIIHPCILKIDVQGFEMEVLEGFGLLLNKVDYIILEESFREIYIKQKKNLLIKKFLKKNNFKLIKKCNLSTLNQRPFQQDVLYKKKYS